MKLSMILLRSMLSERRGFVLISGPYGTGKTHMLAATVNHARKSNIPSVYMNAEELLDHLRRTYALDADVSFDGLWHRVSNATVLCLDELGRENPTPWARAKLFELLDDRYERATVGGARERVLTVIATNLGIAQLDGYLRSRILDVRHDCVAAIELWNTPDMRQRS